MVSFQQLDFTHQAGKADETCVSTVSSTQLSVEDDGKTKKAIGKLLEHNTARQSIVVSF